MKKHALQIAIWLKIPDVSWDPFPVCKFYHISDIWTNLPNFCRRVSIKYVQSTNSDFEMSATKDIWNMISEMAQYFIMLYNFMHFNKTLKLN